MTKGKPNEKELNGSATKTEEKLLKKPPINRSKLGPDYVAPDGGYGWFVALAAGCSNVSGRCWCEFLCAPIIVNNSYNDSVCILSILSNRLSAAAATNDYVTTQQYTIALFIIVLTNKNHKDTAW